MNQTSTPVTTITDGSVDDEVEILDSPPRLVPQNHHDETSFVSPINTSVQQTPHHTIEPPQEDYSDLESVPSDEDGDDTESIFVLPILHTFPSQESDSQESNSEIPPLNPSYDAYKSPYVTTSSRKSRKDLMYTPRKSKTPAQVRREVEKEVRSEFRHLFAPIDQKYAELMEQKRFTPERCDAIMGLGFISPNLMQLGESATSKLRPKVLDFESPTKKTKFGESELCEDFWSPPPLPKKPPETEVDRLRKELLNKRRSLLASPVKPKSSTDPTSIVTNDILDLMILFREDDNELEKIAQKIQNEKYRSEFLSIIRNFVKNYDFLSEEKNTTCAILPKIEPQKDCQVTMTPIKKEEHSAEEIIEQPSRKSRTNKRAKAKQIVISLDEDDAEPVSSKQHTPPITPKKETPNQNATPNKPSSIVILD